MPRYHLSDWTLGRLIRSGMMRLCPPVSETITDAPLLSEKAKMAWLDAIGKSSVYLEYGSGGSTIKALAEGKTVITVESDRRFLEAIKNKTIQQGLSANFHPIYADIGITAVYGNPVFVGQSKRRLARWRSYPFAPWPTLRKLGCLPDVILIDGRFRVATVLHCLLELPDTSDCLILFDDFGVRDYYKGIMEFVKFPEMHGELLSFRKDSTFDREKCRVKLEQFVSDPR